MFIAALILVNVLAIVLESVSEINDAFAEWFWWFEAFSVTVFAFEYLIRLWTCVENARYQRPVAGRLRYASTVLAIVDLIAIIPFFLPFLGFDLRFARMLRLLRLARVAKLGRYSSAVDSIGRVIHDRKHELVASLTFLFMLILVSASLLYFAESEAQPDHFGSIPAAMWWAVVTLTTVGYGDIYPITPIGRVLAGTIAILGIGMVALPTSILGSGFVEQITKRSSPTTTCPHCGKPAELPVAETVGEANG
jgi:voltage-gated potassium channel